MPQTGNVSFRYNKQAVACWLSSMTLFFSKINLLKSTPYVLLPHIAAAREHVVSVCQCSQLPLALFLLFKVSSCWNEKKKKNLDDEVGEVPVPLKAVCNSSWSNPTPPRPENQWWCSNLTDWAQRFVCLKPLTYFYSHCRSLSLYGMIAELMLLVYSKSSLERSLTKVEEVH